MGTPNNSYDWLPAYGETLWTGLASRCHLVVCGQMAGPGPSTPFLTFSQRETVLPLCLGKPKNAWH